MIIIHQLILIIIITLLEVCSLACIQFTCIRLNISKLDEKQKRFNYRPFNGSVVC